ncbi:Rieske (2Fe-2S) protein [Mycobacterium sp.]|jgi:nitrite reductase/ring-hydroxylating ferredoxin subunit|uniref:Rieske (2Fe-2S) protein n=1 Tax=Mycobacterium sp. TaxID=1785 RepID=UPI0028BE64B0|nr:Rieske (2Fe-2S) protein [Mycobacterium sp.]
MNARGLRRYVDDLLAGRRPRPFQPNDFEAAQIRTAIDLRAARFGADAPREKFLTELHRALAARRDGTATPLVSPLFPTRRQVLVGTSAAAGIAAAAVSVDRLVVATKDTASDTAAADTGREMTPDDGMWHRVAASSDVPADADMHPFEVGAVVGFVRRVNGRAEAVSGICTHQGCRLWFDRPDDRLRCPCHSTSFSPAGEVLSHQLSISPTPLPQLQVRENDGAIEVFTATDPTEPA